MKENRIGINLTFLTKMFKKNSESFFLSGYRKSNELFFVFSVCVDIGLKKKTLLKLITNDFS